METLHLPTDEEIGKAYNQGQKAVIALFHATIGKLVVRLQTLEDRVAKNSQNSGKPPSSDGINKPAPKSLRKRRGKKSGGQPGHVGITLKAIPNPDHVKVYPVDQCQHCQMSLREVKADHHEKRQVFDLPPMRMEVTEHRAEVKCCPQCSKESKGEFPLDVTQPVQYGAEVKAQAVFLNQYQMIPLERVSETFEEFYGQGLADGTIVEACQEAAKWVAPVMRAIKQYLAELGKVVHFDETGLRINGKLYWLHVACTVFLTYYEFHAKRGQDAMDAIGILPGFGGTAVHDGLKSYWAYKQARHGLCNEHHRRELEFIGERYPQDWVAKFADLLVEIKKAVDVARATAFFLSQAQLSDFNCRYDELVEQGLLENCKLSAIETLPPDQPETGKKKRGRKKQSPPKNLLDRLRDHKEAVLAFMNDFNVPFDNNLAERDIRMMKVKQKISGCFRSERGPKAFCQIRGYISTAKKNGQKALPALRLAFAGIPFSPTFIPLMPE